MNVPCKNGIIHLLQWSNIVHDPDRTPVGCEDEIVLTWVDEDVIDWDGRKIHVKLGPTRTSVKRCEHSKFGTYKQQICIPRMLAYHADDAGILWKV